MNTIAARAVAIGTALAEHSDLPQSSLSLGSCWSHIGVPSQYSASRFAGMREVAQWATAFDTELIISLSYGSTGKVVTNVELGGVPVAVESMVGTAQAYELGRILQRELNRDVSIHIGPAELLAAIDQAVTK